MVSYTGVAVVGTEVGTEADYKVRVATRDGNSSLQDVPLGAKVRVTVEVLD